MVKIRKKLSNFLIELVFYKVAENPKYKQVQKNSNLYVLSNLTKY